MHAQYSICPFLTSLILLLNSASSDKTCSYSVHEPDFIRGSTYQLNLQQLLIDLPRNASQNNYSYNTTYGKVPDAVYGLAMCYADATLAECNDCLTDGSTDIIKLCNSKKSGVAWYDSCMMRYSDASFNATNGIGLLILGIKGNKTRLLNLTDPKKYVDAFEQLIGNLATNASNSPLKIAAGLTTNYTQNETIYALVQCTRYLPPDECRSCLSNLTDFGVRGLTKERHVTSDRTLKAVSCYVRSAFESFYMIPDANPPWRDAPNIGMRSRESSPTSIFGIIIGVMLVLLAS